ncbi:MAG TPA: SDR family NAD(P)-dependent oxidoreductase [Dehalococcoidia bacterium]|nr:SDR family NAD(P)-dependent oxidoreductase [Dehalococcoidia bacterium]
MQLQGKVALVTGASRGLGRIMALALADDGADVICAARTTEDSPSKLPGTIDRTAAEVRERGRRSLALPMNLVDEVQVSDAVERALGEFGRVDILVNNAGVSFRGSVLEQGLARWDLVLGVNLRGAVQLCMLLAPGMVERGEGRIINISSGYASTPGTGRVSYATSKAALNKFTEGFAGEMRGKGVAVNCIELELGLATEGFRFVNPDVDTSSWPDPEIMGDAAVWLARQPLDYTGNVLRIADIRTALERVHRGEPAREAG